MSTPQAGPYLKTWYRWKALRLPWRRKFLVGLDLQGNTYWTFRLAGTEASDRWRRIVKYPSGSHLSDVKVPPQWHQWLKYQREQPPSIAEQAQEVRRQRQIKLLAAEADARWEAKPRVMDIPCNEKGQPLPALNTGATQPQEQLARGADGMVKAGAVNETRNREGAGKQKQTKDDPWKRASRPGESWQPEAWSPPATKRR